jgi:hypothetical protein
MPLTIDDLIKELTVMSPYWEVHLEIKGEHTVAHGVSIDSDGVTTYVTISDFPDKYDDIDK